MWKRIGIVTLCAALVVGALLTGRWVGGGATASQFQSDWDDLESLRLKLEAYRSERNEYPHDVDFYLNNARGLILARVDRESVEYYSTDPFLSSRNYVVVLGASGVRISYGHPRKPPATNGSATTVPAGGR